MTVTIMYVVTGRAHFEKEVPDGATYDDIIKSVTLEEVRNANVKMVDIPEVFGPKITHDVDKLAMWRELNSPRIYHIDGDNWIKPKTK